jgi:Eco57I restriction-modification methylase
MTQEQHSPEELARAVGHVADSAESEMDLQVKVSKLLGPYLQDLPGGGPEKYGHHAARFRGIQDALHGSLIIEYERPGKLAKRAGLDECLGQLREYLTQEAQQHGSQAKSALKRMVGVGLDGQQIVFVRYRGKGAEPFIHPKGRRPQLTFFPDAGAQDFYVDGPHPVTPESIATFLGYLHSLARLPLSPEALAETFGPKANIAHAVIGHLYGKLRKSDNRRVETFFAEWQRIFGIVYGQDIGKAEEDARALGKQFEMRAPPKLKEFLFCVHTYFALLMKLLAAEVMTLQRGAMMQSFITPLVSASSEDFRKALKDLEDGGLFARQGINNFLEGDFFSWYLSVCDKPLTDELRVMLRALARFDPRTPYLAPEQSRDLLKKLYQYLVPKKLRHDLGEFYTPDWLAEHLLNQLGYNGDLDKRLLDPACGSGTFLVLAIRRMKEWALQHDPPIDAEIVAKKILDNLCGFDLNPIAVIAARTNFLLALGELRRHLGEVELPIYMADSVLTPSQHKRQRGMLEPGYPVPTRAGVFVIPREYVDGGQVARLAVTLEEAVRDGLHAGDFVKRVRRELGMTHAVSEDLLLRLHAHIARLEKDDRNRIWARFIKNSFAPVFKSEPGFDYVAGNPPWVNWESLAEEYRAATKQLWADYGFFTQRGYRAVVPAGKLELAALFAYAAADSYLADRGKLGFVITQSVFKTRGAGEGFRNFMLPGETPLRVEAVDDMVALQPFEGAANRTATVVLKKGEKTEYPVRYAIWHATPDYLRIRKTFNFEPPLSDVESSIRKQDLAAIPVDVSRPNSPWMTVPYAVVPALRKITGASPYKAREGVNTLGANAVYWLRVREKLGSSLLLAENVTEGAKKKVKQQAVRVESDLVYPLLRGRDVSPWNATPSLHILVTHPPTNPKSAYDESHFRTQFPRAHAYLCEHKDLLRRRVRVRKLGMPWYALGEIGPYTFAPFKVTWGEVGNDMAAAVVSEAATEALGSRLVVPDHTVITVSFVDKSEAHFVAAQLNSSPARLVVRGYIVLHPSPHVLEQVGLRKFDPAKEQHQHLAQLSIRAHQQAAKLAEHPNDEGKQQKLAETENEIDHAAAKLWGLTDGELGEIRKALELLR